MGAAAAAVLRRESPLRVALDTAGGAEAARIVVTGFKTAALAVWRARGPAFETGDTGRSLPFTVTVADNAVLPVVGRYVVNDTAVVFHPRFPLDVGRVYQVRAPGPRSAVISSTLPGDSGAVLPLVGRVVRPPRPFQGARATVRVWPASSAVPENQLRFYLEFSAPMSYHRVMGFATLWDEQGRLVPHAFLPFDPAFWNAARTRYTLVVNPARVKRAVQQRTGLGPVLRAGHTYTLVIDSAWRDAEGRPLAAGLRHRLQVGPPRSAPLRLREWRVEAPRAGSRAALRLRFPWALDRALVQRALRVRTARGEPVEGTVVVADDATGWQFVPAAAWRAGPYALEVWALLEDPAGNRLDQPFEAAAAVLDAASARRESYTLPFVVR